MVRSWQAAVCRVKVFPSLRLDLITRRVVANSRGRSWIVYPSNPSLASVIFMLAPDGAGSEGGVLLEEKTREGHWCDDGRGRQKAHLTCTASKLAEPPT